MMDYVGALSGRKTRKDLVQFLENTRGWLPHFPLSTCCVLTVQWLLALPGRNKIWNYLSLCIPSFLLACQICLVEQSYWLSLQNIKLSRGTSYTMRTPHRLQHTEMSGSGRQKGWNVRTIVLRLTCDWASHSEFLEKICQVVGSSFLFCRVAANAALIDIISLFQVK